MINNDGDTKRKPTETFVVVKVTILDKVSLADCRLIPDIETFWTHIDGRSTYPDECDAWGIDAANVDEAFDQLLLHFCRCHWMVTKHEEHELVAVAIPPAAGGEDTYYFTLVDLNVFIGR